MTWEFLDDPIEDLGDHMNKEHLVFPLVEDFEQIAIFVQKNNDLDSCSCALALAELIKETYGDKKNVSILGIYGKSKFLTEMKKYDKKPIDWEKDTLVILSEISSKRQINESHIKEMKKGKAFIFIDHHEFDEEEHKGLRDALELENNKVYWPLIMSNYKSACEVLWHCIKGTNMKLTKRIGEILFMGIYADSKNFTSERIDSCVFKHISEIVEATGIEAGQIVRQLKHRPIEQLMLFANTVAEGVQEGNMLCIELNPKQVFKWMPKLIMKGKDGKLRQKSLSTFIPRLVEEYSDVNTIVFTHYSLYDPYDSVKRFVYIVLIKENPALAQILKEKGFKQNRNRWSKEMNYYNLAGMISKYKEFFVA